MDAKVLKPLKAGYRLIRDRLLTNPPDDLTERDAERPSRVQIVVWVLLTAVVVFVSLYAYQAEQLGSYNDDAVYVVLARSLVFSERFGVISGPGAPTRSPFPFGYPLLLAPLVALFPGNFDALKLLSLAATALNGALLFWGWRWFSRRLSYWWGLAVVGCSLLSPLVISFSRSVMTEAVFTSFYLLAALLTERAIRRKQRWWWYLILGVCLLFVAAIKTVGILMAAGILLSLILAYRKKAWKRLLGIGVALAGLLFVIVVATPVKLNDVLPVRYVSQYVRFALEPAEEDVSAEETAEEAQEEAQSVDWQTQIELTLEAARNHVADHIPSTLISTYQVYGDSTLESLLFGLVVVGMVLLGWGRWLLREGLSAFSFSGLIYLGFLFVWLWKGQRLLYPIHPQLFLALLLGIDLLLNSIARLRVGLPAGGQFWNGLLAGLVILLIGFSISTSLNLPDTRQRTGDLEARTDWIRTDTSDDAVLLSENPLVDYLYSGRKAVWLPWGDYSREQLAKLIRKDGVDYVLIVAKPTRKEGVPLTYDYRTENWLPAVKALEAAGELELVHTSTEPLAIQIYKTVP